MSTTIRALAYLRVSTATQVEHGISLEAQETMLRNEAERRGWSVEVIREEGKSAKSMNRPALQAALKRLDAHEADVLLAVRVDRVSRSVSDFAALMTRAERRGWAMTFSDSDIDMTSPSGRFAMHVVVAAAEFERALVSQRTRETMAAAKIERGAVYGRVVADDMLPVYERVCAAHAAGQSMNAIAAMLNDDGTPTARGGKWAASTVRRILLSETARREGYVAA